MDKDRFMAMGEIVVSDDPRTEAAERLVPVIVDENVPDGWIRMLRDGASIGEVPVNLPHFLPCDAVTCQHSTSLHLAAVEVIEDGSMRTYVPRG